MWLLLKVAQHVLKNKARLISCMWQLKTKNTVLHCQPLQSCVEFSMVLRAVQLLDLATCIIECYPVAESFVTFKHQQWFIAFIGIRSAVYTGN